MNPFLTDFSILAFLTIPESYSTHSDPSEKKIAFESPRRSIINNCRMRITAKKSRLKWNTHLKWHLQWFLPLCKSAKNTQFHVKLSTRACVSIRCFVHFHGRYHVKVKRIKRRPMSLFLNEHMRHKKRRIEKRILHASRPFHVRKHTGETATKRFSLNIEAWLMVFSYGIFDLVWSIQQTADQTMF